MQAEMDKLREPEHLEHASNRAVIAWWWGDSERCGHPHFERQSRGNVEGAHLDMASYDVLVLSRATRFHAPPLC